MKLSKTTQNKATKNNLHLEVVKFNRYDEEEKNYYRVEIFGTDEDGDAFDEFTAAYRMTDNGFFFDGGCFNTEDMPHWIKDEKSLRDLLPAFAAATPF